VGWPGANRAATPGSGAASRNAPSAFAAAPVVESLPLADEWVPHFGQCRKLSEQLVTIGYWAHHDRR